MPKRQLHSSEAVVMLFATLHKPEPVMLSEHVESV